MNLNGTKTDWKHILIPQEMPYWYQGYNLRKIYISEKHGIYYTQHYQV